MRSREQLDDWYGATRYFYFVCLMFNAATDNANNNPRRRRNGMRSQHDHPIYLVANYDKHLCVSDSQMSYKRITKLLLDCSTGWAIQTFSGVRLDILRNPHGVGLLVLDASYWATSTGRLVLDYL